MRFRISKKYLFFREEAKKILQSLRREKVKPRTIYLDFSKVHFISRGFADELLNRVQEIRQRGVRVKFQNLSIQSQQMLRQVQKAKTEIRRVMAHR